MTLASGLRRGVASLRIAGRDVRKQPRDGLLVASLVALPVAIVMAVGLVVSSGVPTPAEKVAAELGGADAWVETVAPPGTAVHQYALTEPESYGMDGDETGAPDRDPSSALPAGARVFPLTRGTGLVATDKAADRLAVLVGDAWDPALTGRFQLVGGRAPKTASEAMVSPALAASMGVAIGDEITVGDGAATYAVVGLLSQPRVWDEGAAYVPTIDTATLDGAQPPQWFVVGAPIDTGRVGALNADGFVAFGRAAVLTSHAQVAAATDSNGASGGMAGTAGVGAFEVALLAGAAFAVGMRRRQQTMAMLAATGANRGMLVRIGVARGAVLGATGAVLGIPVGILGGWAWLALLGRWGGAEGLNSYWGFHLKPAHVAFAAIFGIAAGVLASLVPSFAAARLDVMAALRGTHGVRRLRPYVTVAGAVLLAVGGAAMVFAGRAQSRAMDVLPDAAGEAHTHAGLVMVAAFVILFAGAMVLVPGALRGIASALSSRGVGARMAARDAARNLGRTVPVVAAIAVTVVMATLVIFGAVSDLRLFGIDHVAIPGDAYAYIPPADDGAPAADSDALDQAVQDAIPGAHTHIIERWPSPWDGVERSVTVSVPKQNQCPDVQTGIAHMTARERAVDPRCAVELGNESLNMAVGDVDLLRYLLGHEPSPEAKAALEAGGAVALNPVLVSDGHATLNLYDATSVVTDAGLQPADTLELPAVAEEPEFILRDVNVVVSDKVAKTLGIDLLPAYLMIDAGDPISPTQALALNATLARVSRVDVSVVDGIDPMFAPLTLASLIVVLIVAGAATGLALGLARAEARRDDFTLASLGASPALVKRSAAWQAGILVFVSISVGVGCALAMNWASSQSDVKYGFDPPWLLVAAMVLVVPVLVAAIAWVFTRQPRAVHFRLAA